MWVTSRCLPVPGIYRDIQKKTISFWGSRSLEILDHDLFSTFNWPFLQRDLYVRTQRATCGCDPLSAGSCNLERETCTYVPREPHVDASRCLPVPVIYRGIKKTISFWGSRSLEILDHDLFTNLQLAFASERL
ncbi:hypothetical protein AVEN_259167-1, partial [Araneus ventricosus]